MSDSTNTSREFGLDKRGVSEVIGSVLVFGIVIMLLSIIQMQAIPSANEEIEYKHSKAVQEDLTSLQASLSRAGFQNDRGSTAVKLGTTYPTRLLFYNPPPVTGTLRTTPIGSITLKHVQANGNEVNDYFSKEKNSFSYKTKSIVYSANYNEYRNAPKSIIEGTIAYQSYDGETRIRSSGRFVDGRQITLLLIGGSLSESGVAAESIETTPLSAPAQTVSVSGTEKPITVTVPTKISEQTWVTKLLADEIDDPDGGVNRAQLEQDDTTCGDIDSGHVSDNSRYVKSCSYDADAGTITLTFEPGATYDLRVAKVGMGKTEQKPEARYLVPKGDLTVTTVDTGQAQMTVQVRDKYNNPVSGETVTFNLPNGPKTVKSNAAGEATVMYEPKSAGTHLVTASIGSTKSEKVTFSVQVVSPGRKTIINPASGVVLKTTNSPSTGCALFSTCSATATLENKATKTKTIDSLRVSVYADTTPGPTGDTEPPTTADISAQKADAKIDDLRIGGQAKEFDKKVTFSPNGGTEVLAFKFNDGNYPAEAGDFFVVEMNFEDGSSATYFIPVASSGGGSP